MWRPRSLFFLTKASLPSRDITALKINIQQRLFEGGYLPFNNRPVDSMQLSTGIKNYQFDKGLKVDGKIGAETIHTLNDFDNERFIRIAITLDRYKHLSDQMPSKYVWVNLPGYDMKLVENDTVKLYSKIVIGIVGNYLYVKGVIDFINAAKICIEKGLDIEFWMIGDNGKQKKSILKKYFKYSQDAREEIVDFINENKLEDKIKLIPFTTNITSYYQQIDILCFPSHFNAPGRPIFEAGVFKIPSIVAVEEPTSDTIVNHQSGICIQPKNVEKLAEAMQFFYDNPKEIVRMGQGAYELSQQNFDISSINGSRACDPPALKKPLPLPSELM